MKKERNLKAIDGKWYLDFSFRGKRYIRLGGLTKQAARDAMVRLRVELLNEPEIEDGYPIEAKDPTFSDFADTYLKIYAKRNKRSWQRDEYSIAHLKPFFGRYRLSQIKLILIEKYKIWREAQDCPNTKKGPMPATINRELACLKQILSYAIDNDELVTFPLKRIKIDTSKERKRDRVLKPSEEADLLKAAAPHLRPMIILALNTGMRSGEIKKLKREHIDFAERIITVPVENSKSKRSRRIPMNAAALEIIKALAPAEGFIFRKSSGEPYKNITGGFTSACQRAEIKDLRFHDLRHTFLMRFKEAGGDFVVLSKIMGHSSINFTYEHYYHESTDAMLAAVEKPAEHERQGERSGRKSLIH